MLMAIHGQFAVVRETFAGRAILSKAGQTKGE
jgi:hypothetical protein